MVGCVLFLFALTHSLWWPPVSAALGSAITNAVGEGTAQLLLAVIVGVGYALGVVLLVVVFLFFLWFWVFSPCLHYSYNAGLLLRHEYARARTVPEEKC